MIETEKAYDMLPVVVDLYDKLDIKEYRKKMAKEYEGQEVDQTAVGIDMFKFVLKNSKKIKEEVFEMVAIFQDKTAEEVKAQNFAETVKAIKEIFTDEAAMALFGDAIR